MKYSDFCEACLPMNMEKVMRLSQKHPKKTVRTDTLNNLETRRVNGHYKGTDLKNA